MRRHAKKVVAGAAAFHALMARVGSISNAGFLDADEAYTRDYVAMVAAVDSSLRTNLDHADPAHREGYLRAIAALLCLVADEGGPGDNWDPLRETTESFEVARAAQTAIARAGTVIQR